MLFKSTSLLTLCIFFIQAKASSLNVSLYYEALCPDSQIFVVDQLYPSYQLIGNYLNIEYVPFGFAQASNETGEWVFTCQHGPRECFGNIVQSIVIAKNLENVATEFINCAFSNDAGSSSDLEECATKNGISWDEILNDINDGLGDKLLLANQERTESVTPPLNYVPSIIFNGVYDETLQEQGEHHFLKTACQLLDQEPENCASIL